MTEQPQTFGDARKDAMAESDRDARPLRFDSPGSIDARTSPGSAQIVQVETLGKHGLLLLFLCAFVAAVSTVGFLFVLFELKTVNARYAILQYDQQALKAQLVAKGLYEGTEH